MTLWFSSILVWKGFLVELWLLPWLFGPLLIVLSLSWTRTRWFLVLLAWLQFVLLFGIVVAMFWGLILCGWIFILPCFCWDHGWFWELSMLGSMVGGIYGLSSIPSLLLVAFSVLHIGLFGPFFASEITASLDSHKLFSIILKFSGKKILWWTNYPIWDFCVLTAKHEIQLLKRLFALCSSIQLVYPIIIIDIFHDHIRLARIKSWNSKCC